MCPLSHYAFCGIEHCVCNRCSAARQNFASSLHRPLVSAPALASDMLDMISITVVAFLSLTTLDWNSLVPMYSHSMRYIVTSSFH